MALHGAGFMSNHHLPALPGIAAESISSKRTKEICRTGNFLVIRSTLPSFQGTLRIIS
jgi:hypothetical protein